MRRLFISLMLTLTAFIVNAQPSAIAPRDYQQMLKKGIDVDWWGRSEKNKYGAYSETAVKRFAQQGIKHVRFRLHHYHFTDEDFKRLFSQINTCMQNDLIPIIAFSAKPYKENPNAGEHEKVVEWWKMMAEKCKDLSPMVSFDLIVEPSDQVKKRCGRRCSECGCEVCYTHDEGDYFPEECCVSASGEPFEDCCDDVYGTIGEAIREWTSKPFFTPFTSRCRK